jgi:uncharacterized membrane protein
MPTLGLDHPAALLLLLPLVALAGWDARRLAAQGAQRQHLSGAGARLALTSCLVLVLAGPRCAPPGATGPTIFVLDRSASISAGAWSAALARLDRLRRDAGPGKAGLVVFDAAPEVVVAPGAPWELPFPLRPAPAPEGSDPAAALRTALALLPERAAGQVVMLTDGRATAGDLERAAAEARGRGVRVHVVALDERRRDPAVLSIALPSGDLRPGATLAGRVALDGGDAARAGRLTVDVGGRRVLDQEVALPPGRPDGAPPLEVPFSHALDPARDRGALTVTARLVVAGPDGDLTNNEARVDAMVGDAPHVLVLASAPSEAAPLARVLKAEGMLVDLRDLGALPGREPDLDGQDLVILVNAPAIASDGTTRTMPARFVHDMRRWVSRGGGLLVVGGDRAFNAGGYARAGLGEILPVELNPKDKSVDSTATVVIVLDRSGSMAVPASPGKTKISLADEGAVASLRMLRSFDSVAVMSVDEVVHWNVPMRVVGDGQGMAPQVLAVNAGGGGIFIYTSLVAAHEALARVTTPLRHVILFSDAADAEEPTARAPVPGASPTAEGLAANMHTEGITTSVIGIGRETDKDTAFLRRLAAAGGGRFHITNDAAELKSLFVQETQQLLENALREKPFHARAVRRHAVLDGVAVASAPELRGYVRLEARKTAEVALEGPKHDPLLALWRYGLGEVAVFASDAGPRWAAPWLGWKGYDRLWTQLARFALRRHEGDDAAVDVRFAGSEARVTLARHTADGLARGASAHATLTEIREGGVAAEPAELALVAREPGTWEATAATRPGGRYRLTFDDGEGHPAGSRWFAAPPSGERTRSGADRALLGEVARKTGGTLDPDTVAPPPGRAPGEPRPLAPWLLALGALLAPADAWLRRTMRG